MKRVRSTTSTSLALCLIVAMLLVACGGQPAPVTQSTTAPAAVQETAAPSVSEAQTAAVEVADTPEAAAEATAVDVADTPEATAEATAVDVADTPEAAAEATAPAESSAVTLEEFTSPVADAYDPPIVLRGVAVSQPAVKYPEGDTFDNNAWTRAYERKYGIKLETLWAVDGSQYEQKMNLTIASGDLPDYFQVNELQLKQLVEADLVEDLTDVFEQHASQRVKDVMMEGGPIPLQSATYDGRLLAIPWTSNTKEASPVLWVRSDWLKKLNLPEPRTMQDLLKVSEAFMTKDPDGDGQDDTLGLVMDKTLYSAIGFMNGYHAYKGIWIKDDDGKLVYSSIQPETREALQQLQAMYKAGQIDREFGNKEVTPQVHEDLVAQKLGMYFGAFGGQWQDELKKNEPEADWIALPLPSVDDQPARPQVEQPTVAGYWVVRKGYEHPEAMLKLIEFWIDAFYYTPSDEVYQTFVDDTELDSPVWLLTRAQVYRVFKNVELYETVTRLVDSENPDLSQLRPEPRDVYKQTLRWLEDGDVTYYSFAKAFYGPTSPRAVEAMYRDENLYMEDQFYGTPTATMSRRGSTLETQEEETFTMIIQGAPIEEFDRFVEQWKQLGGDTITEEVNAWLAEQQ